MTPVNYAVLVLALVCPAALGVDPFPVVSLAPPGTRLKDLPGADILSPTEIVENIEIEITPGTIKANDSNGLLLQFNADVYKVKGTDTVYLFGPTIRTKRGSKLSITITNNLEDRESNSTLEYGVGETNLHTHGPHDDPGIRSQQIHPAYEGEDNVFVHIPGKATPDSEPSSLNFTATMGTDHLPGLHWYHPHKHGSTTVQAFTANGLIILEDDPVWLPDSNGCEEIRTVLDSVEDVIIHFELLTVGIPQAAMRNALDGLPLNLFSDANYQIASFEGNSTLCCNNTDPAANPTSPPGVPGAGLLLGSASNEDIAFINGGYQPIIPMRSGEWQRWRMAHTGYKRFMDLQIFDPDTDKVTSDCEMLLIAKDGIYLLEIPRVVNNIILSSANRAELLVRCSGPVGKKYNIQSGKMPPDVSFSFGSPPTLFLSHNQTIVATVEIEEGGERGSDIKPRACTPLRPSYAADMRDEVVKAANVLDKIYVDPNVTFGGTLSGCSIGGQEFIYPDPNPVTLPLGRIVEWDVYGTSGHPLHVHVNPMQITGMGQELLFPNTTYTSYFEVGDYQDTVFLPMLTLAPNAQGQLPNITLRVQPGPYGGYAVVHCHFLQHEDAGCARVTKWQCPGFDGDYQPSVCENFTYPIPGTFTKADKVPDKVPESGAAHSSICMPLIALVLALFLYCCAV